MAHIETDLIHAGQTPDPTTGAIMTPIYQTSTYVQTSPGKHQGYEYSRTHNPTRTALQDNLAALEKANHALVFATGMAAIDTVLKTLNAGDEVIANNDLYGGTYRIFTKVYAKYGIQFKFMNMETAAELEAVKAAVTTATKYIWIETPTNPTLKIIDIQAVANISKASNIKLVVDNTFASSYLQSPIVLGADVVMHSLTKYMAGHSDTVMGALMLNDTTLFEELSYLQNAAGSVPGPQDCFLVLRGLKTLHVRMDRHGENASKVADFLATHPQINKVYYPGLATHTNHAVAAKQMRNFGGMLSFELKANSIEKAFQFVSSTKLFALAESLGGVESLIGHPATMTHASIPREERLKSGVTDSLIRISVGIENIADLLEDLTQALQIIE